MSSTAFIHAVLILLAVFLVLWGSFVLRDGLANTINDEETEDIWKILLYLPFLVMWIWCFILEIILTIIGILLIIDAANGLKKWWHSQ